MLIAGHGVDPLLHLAVEGGLEAVDVRLAHGVAVAVDVADVDPLLVAQPHRGGLQHELALDGVGVLQVDVDLVVDAHAGLGVHDDDDRVDEVVEAVSGRLGALHTHLDDLLTQEPAHRVDLVDRRVVDGHARGVGLRHGGVAVTVVDQEGLAVLAVVENLFHLVVGGVETAHEAHGDELLAGLLLGLHDGDAVLGGGGQWLLAQDVLAGLDGLDDVGGVDLAEGGDEDGVDVRVVDELIGAVVGLGAVGLRGRDRGLVVDVGHGDDFAARQVIGNAGQVRAAHAAGADESDAYSHDVSPR